MLANWSACLIEGTATVGCVEMILGRLLIASSRLIIAALFIMLVIGSFQYLISGGNPEKVKKATAALTWAFAGTVLFVSGFLIIKTIDVLFLAGKGALFTFDIPQFKQSPVRPAPSAFNPPIVVIVPTQPPTQPAQKVTAKEQAIQEDIDFVLANYPQNKTVYKEASRITSIPAALFAGIHLVEGASVPNRSLVSGRNIGSNEPDVVAGGGCSSKLSGVGVPVPVPGGCGFASLLDSAVYAGVVLKRKTNGNLSSFEQTVTALSRYNGPGNANCGMSSYPNCPRLYEGEDHPYPLNFFDSRHEAMYRIYCADHVKCQPLKKFLQPGVLTVARTYKNE